MHERFNQPTKLALKAVGTCAAAKQKPTVH